MYFSTSASEVSMVSKCDPDKMHRLVKEALDSGAAQSLEEARALFSGYRIAFDLAPEAANSRAHQSALLSGVALAKRVFLGGTFVTGPLDAPLLVPLPLGRTLGEAVKALGGIPADVVAPQMPRVVIGGPPRQGLAPFDVRASFVGWRGGILPANARIDWGAEREAMPLASLLAAALAVNEAFLHVRREGAMAGRRSVGMSLWEPSFTRDWVADGDHAASLRLLPARLWLIGLGHLGQAYLWALGLLPFPAAAEVELVLQDVDVITASTESTSVLTDPEMLGLMKTRAMADWCERRGFKTRIHERLFDDGFRRQEAEPAVALCGLDNALGRRALDGAGFRYVIEAGLGRGYQDFRTLRLHTLPGTRSAQELWRGPEGDGPTTAERPAYRKMLIEGGDRCGITTLAGKAVGAPFVGVVAACLVIAEVLRLLNDGPQYELIDLDLMNIEYGTAVPRPRPPAAFNPGYVSATL
jgi:hypothetical protein